MSNIQKVPPDPPTLSPLSEMNDVCYNLLDVADFGIKGYNKQPFQECMARV